MKERGRLFPPVPKPLLHKKLATEESDEFSVFIPYVSAILEAGPLHFGVELITSD